MQSTIQTEKIVELLRKWSEELGFDNLTIADLSLGKHRARYIDWIKEGLNGDMKYLERNIDKRLNPSALFDGLQTIICVQMNYMTDSVKNCTEALESPKRAYISRYALGRDYHKTMRKSLKSLGANLKDYIGPFGYRVFADSAPILERGFAEQSGMGWIGKNTMLINRENGSFFFLGEIFTDIKLPFTQTKTKNLCGSCRKCIDICPTGAIIAPYKLDARKCISYLTIENKGAIPEELRANIGNRIFGCDDCQLCCPWNKYAKITNKEDFQPRHNLDNETLVNLFLLTEEEFEKITIGSPIRRISYEQWRRNIAVAMGNATHDFKIIETLKIVYDNASMIVREHINWALEEQKKKKPLVNSTA